MKKSAPWFRRTGLSWFPISWQGWMFAVVWSAALLLGVLLIPDEVIYSRALMFAMLSLLAIVIWLKSR